MRKCVIGLILVVILSSWGTAGATAFLRAQEVGGDPSWWQPMIYDNGAIVQVEIWLEIWGDGVNAVQFKLELPDNPELTLTNVSFNPGTLYLGSPETGVIFSLVGCKTASLKLCTLTFQSTGLTACYPLKFVAHPEAQTGGIEAVNCSSVIVPSYGYDAMIAPAGSGYACAAPPPPSNPSPADGAVNMPISTQLSWDYGTPPLDCAGGICAMTVYFGTDPNHWPPYYYDVGPPLDVGTLQPNTTYYWKVVHGAGVWGVSSESPVWSFTTTDGVGVATSTWGAIKALYR